jgi:hypothetical protein
LLLVGSIATAPGASAEGAAPCGRTAGLQNAQLARAASPFGWTVNPVARAGLVGELTTATLFSPTCMPPTP